MSRTKDITSAIFRNLKVNGISTEEIDRRDIYYEINAAQIDIMTRCGIIKKSFSLSLLTDVSEYSLSEFTQDKLKVLRVEDIITQKGLKNIEFVHYKDWNKKIKSCVATAQPSYCTLHENKLKIFPVPVSDIDVTVFVILSSPLNDVDDETDPETPIILDKALEFYATEKFLPLSMQAPFIQKYEHELEVKGYYAEPVVNTTFVIENVF